MTADDFTPDDWAAARKQGDLVAALLATTGRTRKTAKPEPGASRPGPPDYGPHHRVGAWPFGLGNPGPNTCHPDCGCAITPRRPGDAA